MRRKQLDYLREHHYPVVMRVPGSRPKVYVIVVIEMVYRKELGHSRIVGHDGDGKKYDVSARSVVKMKGAEHQDLSKPVKKIVRRRRDKTRQLELVNG